MKTETIVAALALAALAMSASSGNGSGEKLSPLTSPDDAERAARVADLTKRLKVAGVKEPEGGWTIPDALLGVKDMALTTRRAFKENEQALTLILTAVAGPEAAMLLQAGDSIVDWVLGEMQ